MTDRELLELAAKACGYDTSHHWNAERLTVKPPVIGLCIKDISTCWNPLEDDGDALRLAVKLRLACDFSEDDIDVISWAGESGALTGEADNGDRQSCARRAIVRAAAEIGKTLGE